MCRTWIPVHTKIDQNKKHTNQGLRHGNVCLWTEFRWIIWYLSRVCFAVSPWFFASLFLRHFFLSRLGFCLLPKLKSLPIQIQMQRTDTAKWSILFKTAWNIKIRHEFKWFAMYNASFLPLSSFCGFVSIFVLICCFFASLDSLSSNIILLFAHAKMCSLHVAHFRTL